jgi:hypothetical protein
VDAETADEKTRHIRSDLLSFEEVVYAQEIM